MRTRLSVYIASSLDGYIATSDGGLEWLERAATPDEDYGYESFLETVDALAMGRATYDHIARLDPLPFGGRPVFVFTHHAPPQCDGVTFWDRSPRAALEHWTTLGFRRVYVDGGNLISSFLADDLIDDMLLTKIPVLLGAGFPLFHPIAACAAIQLDDVHAFPSGIVTLSYHRAAARPDRHQPGDQRIPDVLGGPATTAARAHDEGP